MPRRHPGSSGCLLRTKARTAHQRHSRHHEDSGNQPRVGVPCAGPPKRPGFWGEASSGSAGSRRGVRLRWLPPPTTTCRRPIRLVGSNHRLQTLMTARNANPTKAPSTPRRTAQPIISQNSRLRVEARDEPCEVGLQAFSQTTTVAMAECRAPRPPQPPRRHHLGLCRGPLTPPRCHPGGRRP
jgi:hypothetical protein